MRPSTAARILADPEFKPLFDGLHDEYLRDFASIDPQDTESMRILRLKIAVLTDVRAKLENLAYDFSQSVSHATKTTP